MNAKKCDRCGKFFDLYAVTNKRGCKFENGVNYLIQANECSEYGTCHKKVYDLDLCLDCCESFNEWIEKGSLLHSNNSVIDPGDCEHCKYYDLTSSDDPCRNCLYENDYKYFEPKEIDT
jgi:hypothetical protein